MTPNYTWIIERMETYSKKDGYDNFVYNIWWRVNAGYNGATATIAGQQPVGDEAGPASWTPFDKITEQEAIAWVQAAMGTLGVLNVQNTLNGLIQNQLNPPATAPNLPWG